ncbi:MAG: glycoside hydrolase family 5 protein [Propionibacteriaceae bacterium]|jgi:hypothetical protein|nr:glycoside hydrolase family 5 protein [Propionibacteriaceae bacterium]
MFEWLSTRGNRIVNESGQTITLTGFGLGGYLNWENFITGFPGTEGELRRALLDEMGSESFRVFFDRFEECFFDAADARYLASLGTNSVRLPINYHHLEDDARPFAIKTTGLEKIDRALRLCEDSGLYLILDLHTLPGAQNQHWHCDNPTHRALFWDHPHFQDRVVNLWVSLAERYRDRPAIAGYNLINEPADPSGQKLFPYYRRLACAIREVDLRHMLFLDGNKYGTDFSMFEEPLDNTVYAPHDYPLAGISQETRFPGMVKGEWQDAAAVRRQFLRRSEYPLANNLPIWVGEFGVQFTGNPEMDRERLSLLQEQLDVYREYGASWSLWTYKDIGLQGIQVLPPESSYLRTTADVRAAKERLGVDSWGGTDTHIRNIIDPVAALLESECKGFDPFPWGTERWTALLIRNIMFSEALLPRFAKAFNSITPNDAEQLASCFAFDACRERTELAGLLHRALSAN